MSLLPKKDGTLVLACDRQKHGTKFAPIALRRMVVDLGAGASSCIITLGGAASAPHAPAQVRLGVGPLRRLRALAAFGLQSEVTTADWSKACGGRDNKANSTHFSHQDKLKAAGVISQGHSGEGHWTITAKGWDVLGCGTPAPNKLQMDSIQSCSPVPTPTPSSPVRGGGEEESECEYENTPSNHQRSAA